MGDITGENYAKANKVCKDFKTNNLGEHYACSKRYIIVS